MKVTFAIFGMMRVVAVNLLVSAGLFLPARANAQAGCTAGYCNNPVPPANISNSNPGGSCWYDQYRGNWSLTTDNQGNVSGGRVYYDSGSGCTFSWSVSGSLSPTRGQDNYSAGVSYLSMNETPTSGACGGLQPYSGSCSLSVPNMGNDTIGGTCNDGGNWNVNLTKSPSDIPDGGYTYGEGWSSGWAATVAQFRGELYFDNANYFDPYSNLFAGRQITEVNGYGYTNQDTCGFRVPLSIR